MHPRDISERRLCCSVEKGDVCIWHHWLIHQPGPPPAPAAQGGKPREAIFGRWHHDRERLNNRSHFTMITGTSSSIVSVDAPLLSSDCGCVFSGSDGQVGHWWDRIGRRSVEALQYQRPAIRAAVITTENCMCCTSDCWPAPRIVFAQPPCEILHRGL